MTACLCKSHPLQRCLSLMPAVLLWYTLLNSFPLGHSLVAGLNNAAHQTNTSSSKSLMGFGAYPERSSNTHSTTEGWRQTSMYITHGPTSLRKITRCQCAITTGTRDMSRWSILALSKASTSLRSWPVFAHSTNFSFTKAGALLRRFNGSWTLCRT